MYSIVSKMCTYGVRKGKREGRVNGTPQSETEWGLSSKGSPYDYQCDTLLFNLQISLYCLQSLRTQIRAIYESFECSLNYIQFIQFDIVITPVIVCYQCTTFLPLLLLLSVYNEVRLRCIGLGKKLCDFCTGKMFRMLRLITL